MGWMEIAWVLVALAFVVFALLEAESLAPASPRLKLLPYWKHRLGAVLILGIFGLAPNVSCESGVGPGSLGTIGFVTTSRVEGCSNITEVTEWIEQRWEVVYIETHVQWHMFTNPQYHFEWAGCTDCGGGEPSPEPQHAGDGGWGQTWDGYDIPSGCYREVECFDHWNLNSQSEYVPAIWYKEKRTCSVDEMERLGIWEGLEEWCDDFCSPNAQHCKLISVHPQAQTLPVTLPDGSEIDVTQIADCLLYDGPAIYTEETGPCTETGLSWWYHADTFLCDTNNPARLLDDVERDEVREASAAGSTDAEIATAYGVREPTISWLVAYPEAEPIAMTPPCYDFEVWCAESQEHMEICFPPPDPRICDCVTNPGACQPFVCTGGP